MARVLVLDDQSAVRLLLRAVVEPLGHEVVEAGDAAEALAAVPGARIDLVLADLNLPGTSGLDFIQCLRHSGWTGPVVVITASERPPDERLQRSLGIVGYLGKPFDLARLREVMTDALGRVAG